MDNLEWAVLIVLCMNLMLLLGQFAAHKVNPDFGSDIVNCGTSPIGTYGDCSGGHYTINTSNPKLPTSTATVDTTTGNAFTDIWNTIKGFFYDTLGLKYITAVVSAPSSFLKTMGVDSDFASLIGAVWWIFTVLLIISYLKR